MDNGTYDNSSLINSTNNTTYIRTEEEEFQYFAYKYFIPPLCIFCMLSLFINIRVLLAVHWIIKRPLTPTLHISLSLAAADACTSVLLCTGLLINSYLPVVCDIHSPCFLSYIIEMYRLCGIIITVSHLLALSINHWLGIAKPLHYTSMMTTRKTIVITTLWLTPMIFFKFYFLLYNRYDPECNFVFLEESEFRIIFFSLLVIPLIIMMFCYGHILHIVRKQQRIWANSRTGSQRIKGGHTRQSTQQRKTMEGNVKAVHTTLLILGSCIVGWLPASLSYLLICDSGCLFQRNPSWDIRWSFFLAWFFNVLVILKTLVNPIIYSTRMMEIKDGMRRMKLSASRIFCNNNNRRDMYTSNLHPLQLGYSGSVNAAGVTALCKLNGSITTKRSIRSNYPNNTLV